MKKFKKILLLLLILTFSFSGNIFAAEFQKGKCSADLILVQNLKAPRYGERYVRNGRYHWYTGAIVRQADILQKHLNRLGFNAGKVDGIIGPKTKGAILRMQKFLGTIQDGYVGPKTRALLNNSCPAKNTEKNIVKNENNYKDEDNYDDDYADDDWYDQDEDEEIDYDLEPAESEDFLEDYGQDSKNYTDFGSEDYGLDLEDESKNKEVKYKVEKGEKFIIQEGSENATHRKIVKWIKTISPDNFPDKFIRGFVIYRDPADGTAASVGNLDYDQTKWNIYVNIDAYEKDDKEMLLTLTHEFSHILSLNNSQVNPKIDEPKCFNFYAGEGCFKKDAYLNKFYNKFWKGKYDEKNSDYENYSKKEDAFVTLYAATNPGEDFAETFAYFVFSKKPKNSDTIEKEKKLFFYNFPEFRKIRNSILSNLKFDLAE